MTKTSTPQVSAASTAIATRITRTTKGKKNAGAIATLAATVISTPKAEETKTPAATPAPVAPAVQAAPVIVKPLGIAYTMGGVRPGSGAALAAHTHAFLVHSGLMSGKPVASAIVREVMGDTAYAYHMNAKQGNFATVGDSTGPDGKVTRGGVVLTSRGLSLFGARRQNLELVSAFEAVLVRGECDERTGNKNPSMIRKIA